MSSIKLLLCKASAISPFPLFPLLIHFFIDKKNAYFLLNLSSESRFLGNRAYVEENLLCLRSMPSNDQSDGESQNYQHHFKAAFEASSMFR